jgi:hypothetical protein
MRCAILYLFHGAMLDRQRDSVINGPPPTVGIGEAAPTNSPWAANAQTRVRTRKVATRLSRIYGPFGSHVEHSFAHLSCKSCN